MREERGIEKEREQSEESGREDADGPSPDSVAQIRDHAGHVCTRNFAQTPSWPRSWTSSQQYVRARDTDGCTHALRRASCAHLVARARDTHTTPFR